MVNDFIMIWILFYFYFLYLGAEKGGETGVRQTPRRWTLCPLALPAPRDEG